MLKNTKLRLKGKTLGQFFKSLLTAWAAFAVDWIIVEILVMLIGGDVSRFKFISYPVALLTTYLLSRNWVFKDRSRPSGNRQRVRELVLYIAGAFVALAISWASIFFLTDSEAMLNFRLSNAIGMALVFLWNFVYRKFVVFRSPSAKDGRDDAPVSPVDPAISDKHVGN